MEEQLLEQLKLQRPPAVFCLLAGAALILTGLQAALSFNASALAAPKPLAVYTPIKLPPAAPKAEKPKRNPFLPPANPQAKPVSAAPAPVLKGIVQNGGTYIAIAEYAGQSGYYRSSDKIGSYTVTAINGSTMQLQNGRQIITLKQEGKAHD